MTNPRSTATSTRTRAAITAPLFETDAYKLGHRGLYPAGTTEVLVNFTNRASRLDGVDKVVHFGLQAFLQSYCIEAFEPFFAADEDEAVNEYLDTLAGVLGDGHGIDAGHIRALHRRGYLPLLFRALPEGTRVPLRVPSITVENTEPEFFWLPNYIETVLSAAIWQPSTSATIANEFRGILDDAAARTGGAPAYVNWQLHDFSFRGMAGAPGRRCLRGRPPAQLHRLRFPGHHRLGQALLPLRIRQRQRPGAGLDPCHRTLGDVRGDQ